MSGQTDWKQLEQEIGSAVKLSRRPVAVSFLDVVPANVNAFEGTEPSGCSFWRLAAAGRVFYTVPKDHFNCAVGAHTHNLPLSPERERETEQTLKMMFDLGYVKPEEVPQIPQLRRAPAAILYALQVPWERRFARSSNWIQAHRLTGLAGAAGSALSSFVTVPTISIA